MQERIGSAIKISLIIVAIPFLSGFSYLNSYYAFFGVSLHELSLSEYFIYVS